MKFLFLFFIISSSYAGGFSGINDPQRILKGYNSTFFKLPLNGEISNKQLSWPGSHWPNYVGGITHRWSKLDPNPFYYEYKTFDYLLTADQSEIDELSPAEKFDILLGDYNFNISRRIEAKYSPKENTWHGICHGISGAQLNHDEPKLTTVKNDDGIEITFYSSDLKGLLGYYYANVAKNYASQVGKRCTGKRQRRGKCKGVNAGSFHILISNFLGVKGKPILMDIDHLREVWNYSAVSYDSYIVDEHKPSRNSSRGTVKRIRVQTELVVESSIQQKTEAVIGTENAEYLYNNYDYYLDIDKDGKIIGGEWISDIKPDFLFTRKKAEFTGKWEKIFDVYTNGLTQTL